jgi:hypothetical protein
LGEVRHLDTVRIRNGVVLVSKMKVEPHR